MCGRRAVGLMACDGILLPVALAAFLQDPYALILVDFSGPLFCVLILLYFLTVKLRAAEIPEPETAAQDLLAAGRCPMCGAPINAGREKCMKCGTKVQPKARPCFCRKCGTALSPGSAFCHRCGTRSI